MSGVVRHWQQPEWSARLNWDFAESTLAKTGEYNPAADAWRPLRPEDIPGATADVWVNTVAIVAGAWTTMIPLVAGFRVPQGIGIGFYGFWIAGADLGRNAGYRILVNSVKRVVCPIHEFMADEKGAVVGLDDTHTGMVFFFHVHYEHPDQLCFVQENDVVQVQLFSEFAYVVGTLEFFPLAIIAGNGKQLLINA
jgi:hypothetical protein